MPMQSLVPKKTGSLSKGSLTLVLLLAFSAYLDLVQYQFVWDDTLMVMGVKHRVEDLRRLPQLVLEDFTTLLSGDIGGHFYREMGGHFYRPIVALSLALDVALFGPRPDALHLTNILLHVVVTFLVSRLVLTLGAGWSVATLASLFFAIYPVHVEAVAWIAARGEMLMSIGVIACLLAHRRARAEPKRRVAWTVAALAFQAMALLSKEPAVVLPGLIVLSDVLVPVGGSGQQPWQRLWRHALIRSFPYWAVLATFAAFRFPTLLAGGVQGASLWHRLPGAWETLARYVWLLLLPNHMRPVYDDLVRPTSFVSLWPLLGIVAGGLLFILLWLFWRRAPLISFGVGWFLITIVPGLDLVAFAHRAMALADRYLYLPSIGIAVLLAVCIAPLVDSASEEGVRGRSLVGWGILILLLVTYSWQLRRYAPEWKNTLSLYSYMEATAPRSVTANVNLAGVYVTLNDLPKARVLLERAVGLSPEDRPIRALLAHVNVLQGRRAAGFQMLDAVASEGPPDRAYYLARISDHLSIGESRVAVAVAEEGVARFPQNGDIGELLGRALTEAGRSEEAIAAYRRALILAPDLYRAHEALGNLLAASGQTSEATEQLRLAAKLRPDQAEPILGLARIAEKRGNRSESLGLWREVLSLGANGAAIKEAAEHLRGPRGR